MVSSCSVSTSKLCFWTFCFSPTCFPSISFALLSTFWLSFSPSAKINPSSKILSLTSLLFFPSFSLISSLSCASEILPLVSKLSSPPSTRLNSRGLSLLTSPPSELVGLGAFVPVGLPLLPDRGYTAPFTCPSSVGGKYKVSSSDIPAL